MSNTLLCRICVKSSTEDSLNLFDNGNAKLLRQIEKLTGKVLEDLTHLPQRICENCLVDLQQANEFRVRCITAQYYFTTEHFKDKLKASSSSYEEKHSEEFQDTETLNEDFQETESEHQDFSDIQTDNDDDNNIDIYDDIYCDEDSRESNKPVDDNLKREIDELDWRAMQSDAEEETRFVCDQCGKPFKRQACYQVHLKRHIGDKSFQCKICSKKFVTNSELKVHDRYHTRETPVPCRFCDRRFKDSTGRRRHELSHTDERPLSCLQCDKKFKHEIYLKAHMSIHSGELPFICTVCNRSFRMKSLLQRHCKTQAHKEKEIIKREVKEI